MQPRRADDLGSHWRTVFADWQASGLTVAAFCRSRNMTPSQFYIWRKRLEMQGAKPLNSPQRSEISADGKAIAAKLKAESAKSVEFAEVKVIDPRPKRHDDSDETNGKIKRSADLLTRKEAAAYLGIAEQTLAVWHCQRKYELPIVKIGASVRYRRADLDQFLVRRTVEIGGTHSDQLAATTEHQKSAPKDHGSVLEIVFASGTQLKLSKACPPDLLEAVVTLLEGH